MKDFAEGLRPSFFIRYTKREQALRTPLWYGLVRTNSLIDIFQEDTYPFVQGIIADGIGYHVCYGLVRHKT